MASDNEASCESDPNFAVICAFMEKFGTTCGLQSIDFLELQEMLENTQEVPQELIDLHIKLLRKSRKTVSNERWEKAIIKFCHTFCVQDAWEIERFGYKKARLSSKLRVLKELLEMQFDFNARFKAEINKMSADELRSQPLGKDKQGHAYWFQNDNNCQIRVYKEDPDEETWTLVAKDREGLASLISELSDGDSKISTESAINEDDSNSLAERPIIDTGQVDSSSDSTKKSGDSENSNESKESLKKENISPDEESSKRVRESDDEAPEEKKPKIVSEAIEEPLMLVKGDGEGEANNCENPIVGEEIEEDLMVFYGDGNGADCETGNEEKSSDSKQSASGDGARDAKVVSISDSKNCVNDEVPTSPVKSPYKLGTIIDTKTDNKFFSAVKSPTKKSRWDVETIIAKDAPEKKWENEEEAPKKAMFFFGPGCLQFSPAAMAFGQKVPPEKNDSLEVLPDKAKGDVGYRIGEENKGETSECVQSETGPVVNDDHPTPIETRIDKLDEEVDDNLGKTKGEDERPTENTIKEHLEKDETDGGRLPEVTAALIGFKVPAQEELAPETEIVCVKKHAYILGGETVENHAELAKTDENENKHSETERREQKSEASVTSTDQKVEASESSPLIIADDHKAGSFPEINAQIECDQDDQDKNDQELDPGNDQKSTDNDHDESPSVETDQKSEVAIGSDQKSEVVIESDQESEIAIDSDQKSEVAIDRDQKSEVVIESDQKSEVTIGSDKKSEVAIDADQKSEVTIDTDQKSEESEHNLVESAPKFELENVIVVNDHDSDQKDEAILESDQKSEDSNQKEERARSVSIDSVHHMIREEKNESSVQKPDSLVEENDDQKEEKLIEGDQLEEKLFEDDQNKDKLVEDDQKEEKLIEDDQKSELVIENKELEKDQKLEESEEKVESDAKSEALITTEIDQKETLDSLEDTKLADDQKEEPLIVVAEENDQKSSSTSEIDRISDATLDNDQKSVIQSAPEPKVEEPTPPKVREIDQVSDTLIENDQKSDSLVAQGAPEPEPKESEETAPELQQLEETPPPESEPEPPPLLDTRSSTETRLSSDAEPPTLDTEAPRNAEAKKSELPTKEAVVYLKLEDKLKADDKSNKDDEKETPGVPAKRGRKNNSSDAVEDEKKPRVSTRRSTRASKNEEVEEKVVEVPPPTRRGRPRANQKVKEEPSEGDSKKIKLEETKAMKSEEAKEAPAETKPEETVDVKTTLRKSKDEPEEKIDFKNEEPEESEGPPKIDSKDEEPEASDGASPSAVIVDSSSSNDVQEVTDKDPLAGEEVKAKPMSLATFSLDFTEAPSPAPPITRSGLRKRGRESPHEETEETAGKRPKMKAKRPVDVKLRKSVEEQKKKELISSDDDSKAEERKKTEEKNDEAVVVSDAEKEHQPKKKKNRKNKNQRLLSNLGIDPSQILNFGQDQSIGVRQSRRIAQLKIKEEAERRKLEEELVHEAQKKKKSKKNEDKDYKVEKKKKDKDEEEDEGDDDSNDSKKRKKKKKKKKKEQMKFDEYNPWRSSSDSSSSNEEEEIGEEEEEEDDDVLQYVSDHEFSPESDMEADGEALPLKRARTARKESDVEEVDDCPCQKCGKSDHPEWILLCDSCDNGWHCSCLRPPLLVIPEGDWFCPPCQHASLLKQLQDKLTEYDKKLNKKEIEDRRKERLAYVGISLNSVLPTKDTENIKKRRVIRDDHVLEDDDDDDGEEDDDDADVEGDDASSEESESGSPTASETGSDSDEPIYQLRQRRQAHSYRFNDYDDLINSAIQDEMEAVKGAGNQGRGKDIATIVNAEKEEEKKKEEAEQGETVEVEPLPPVVPVNDRDKEARPVFDDDDDFHIKKKIVGRKKHRRLNALDISSADEDEDSDEDFKGTSSESDDDFDDDLGSEYSDDLDSGRRKKGSDPIRRSTRARTSRYDADFIDDGESESEDDAPRRKKKRSIWDESESEESDRSWGRRKRKPANRSKKMTPTTPNSSKKKKSKKKKKQQDSDEEVYKKKKPKIKFGMDGDDDGPVRRTRGKKINYVDALGSDSDDDRVKRPPPRIESDEEYVANEDEKVSEEEADSGDEAKGAKIQIQSYTDERFVQVLPEPKNLHEDGDELNPIDQINRNVEMMDENEMEKMMEEEEYANKQLQMVALQLEKEKRRKEREAKKQESPLDPKNRPRKKEFQFTGSMQEPLVGNVDSLIINSENNDELSEPPGVSLPLFGELGVGDSLEDSAKKRRAVKNKKSLEEAVANLGSARQHDAAAPFMLTNKLHPTDLSVPPESNIEIAAPPQPFSQSQPTPSVITRMLQSKPGQPGYPVGTIRPKQFAAMPEREEDVHHAMAAAAATGQYLPGAAGLRPPFRPMAPGLNHYPRPAAPPQIRPHIYHSHRPLDPSPSGGGIEHSPGRVVSPAASSPGSNKNETPPPPYTRPPVGRFPLAAGPRHLQMVPPPHLQPRPNLSPYHPGMPPQYHYGPFGQEDALPPTMYQNSPYSEPFEGQVNPSENSNSKSFEEESGGEFGGLVSYFSSQREDDLES